MKRQKFSAEPAMAVCSTDAAWHLLKATRSFLQIVGRMEAGSSVREALCSIFKEIEIQTFSQDAGCLSCSTDHNCQYMLLWSIITLPHILPLRMLCLVDMQQFGITPSSMTLDAILNSIHDGIWLIDGNGITLKVNKAMERIAGITAKDVVGKQVADAAELSNFSTCVTLCALDKKTSITMFDDYANGRHCLNTSTPIFDAKGNVSSVVAIIRDLAELEDMSTHLETLRTPAQEPSGENHTGLLGVGPASKEVRHAVQIAANTDAPVLLTGETGTGKTLAARVIHKLSDRADGEFVAVNCGGIPPSLMESELFGYEQGAFTGALKKGKKGIFELAHNGTLFLDEIGDLPLAAQSTLLHVLDGEPFRRVGGTVNISVNVRIIAATNLHLEKMVQEGRFRRDLLFRLRIIVIEMPSLAKRREDIPLLLEHFMRTFGGDRKSFSPSLITALLSYAWPGNIRELRSVARYLFALDKDSFRREDLPSYIKKELPERRPDDRHTSVSHSLRGAVADLERRMIDKALRETGSTYKAARVLHTSQTTIVRKAKRYRIRLDAIQHEG